MTNLESSSAETPERTVELAVNAVNDALAAVDDGAERTQVVDDLNTGLADSGVVIVDIEPNIEERRGARTKLTHDQLISAIEGARLRKAMRAARALGRRAL